MENKLNSITKTLLVLNILILAVTVFNTYKINSLTKTTKGNWNALDEIRTKVERIASDLYWKH